MPSPAPQWRGAAHPPALFRRRAKASAGGLGTDHLHQRHLITPEKAALLKAPNVAYVGISLDGIGAVHDEFRPQGRCLRWCRARGFRNCHEVGQKTGLRLTLTRRNVQNIEQILDFIEQEQIQRVCFYHLVPAGRGTSLQVLTPEESRYALDTLIARTEAWHAQGVNRELLTVAGPADGAYLLLRMERENHPNLEEARRLLSWNGGGANSSGRGIANIDTQGNVHPDQFWQDITLGNVKRMPFSDQGGAEKRHPRAQPPPPSRGRPRPPPPRRGPGARGGLGRRRRWFAGWRGRLPPPPPSGARASGAVQCPGCYLTAAGAHGARGWSEPPRSLRRTIF
ncbi:MAG: hypothetical protein IPK32_24415 [Verrucomicrobiaceae bacterium]|nr:hypothetical protein [Verrucomicrobiaceae bacterium]